MCFCFQKWRKELAKNREKLLAGIEKEKEKKTTEKKTADKEKDKKITDKEKDKKTIEKEKEKKEKKEVLHFTFIRHLNDLTLASSSCTDCGFSFVLRKRRKRRRNPTG